MTTVRAIRLLPLCLAGLMLALWSGMLWSVAREDILILAEDGRHYSIYKTLRSNLPARELYLPGDTAFQDYLFFYPPEPQVRQLESGSLLNFEQGDYALIRQGSFAGHELSEQPDGSLEYRSWDGLTLGNGHFGKWNSPDPFEQFTYAWIVPDNIKLLEYECNRPGQWKYRGNTLVWTGRNVNDLAFTIRYRVTPPQRVTVTPAPAKGVSRGDDAGPASRITLDTALLFASGDHQITEQGESLLADLAQELAGRQAASIVVEGHTDNQPLKPYLREKYPSNWELSAARATIVVRYLADHGVSPKVLEARAYGEQHPVASNASLQGRAKNRRIEILVRDRDSRRADQQVPLLAPAQADRVDPVDKAASTERLAEEPGKQAASLPDDRQRPETLAPVSDEQAGEDEAVSPQEPAP